MYIVAISGAHRKGNTTDALHYLKKLAEKKHHTLKLIELKKEKLKFSIGDSNEYYTGKPATKDAMQKIHKEILNADLLLLATPNYFSNVSALMKNFMDRTNPYYAKHEYKGKKAALLVVSASAGNSPKRCLGSLKEFCRIHKMDVVASKILIAEHSADFAKSKKLKKEIQKFADKIINKK